MHSLEIIVARNVQAVARANAHEWLEKAKTPGSRCQTFEAFVRDEGWNTPLMNLYQETFQAELEAQPDYQPFKEVR